MSTTNRALLEVRRRPRGRRSAWWLGPACFAAALLASDPAHGREPVRFEYQAPPGCPDQAAFTARVAERSISQRIATGGELARTFRVGVSVDASGAAARVDFVDGDGRPVSRVVRGGTCDEVVSGIALVTALAIDAHAGTEQPSAPTSPVAPPPSATPTAAVEPAPAPVEREQARASEVSFRAGVGGAFVTWAGPDGGWRGDAFVGISLADAGPSFRLSAAYARASGANEQREAVLRAWVGRLEGCPLAIGTEWLVFEPCAALELGLFRASGVQSATLPEPETKSMLWGAGTAIGRFGFVLERRLVFEAQGELGVPFAAGHDFGFERPRAVLFEVPALSAGARAGIGMRFP